MSKRKCLSPMPLQAVPASLQELARQIDDADKYAVAPDLPRDAAALVEAAWDGSMCEGIIRRRIPLGDAIRRSTAALDAAAFAYITTVPAQIRAMVGDAFDDAQFTRDNLTAFNALKSLEFEGLGTVHYEHIQAALTENEGAWRGGSNQYDVYAILQFCVRIVQLTESLRKRTGRRIANDVVGTTTLDGIVRPQLVYNSAAGRIVGGQDWPQCVDGPFDWARLFGPSASADDDDEEDGPWLTPRMAARIHCAAIEDAERMLLFWEEDQSLPRLPKVARPYFKSSKEWRDSFQECYVRIAMRLQKGLPPQPNCTGEELAFYNILPRVFMLGSGGDRLRATHIHPSEWFHAFRDDNFNDHFPSAAI